MRRKAEAVLSFDSSDDGLPKVVRQYRARYRAISQVLDANPEILAAVHKDLAKLSSGNARGRIRNILAECSQSCVRRETGEMEKWEGIKQ
jgi:hypothetical protein